MAKKDWAQLKAGSSPYLRIGPSSLPKCPGQNKSAEIGLQRTRFPSGDKITASVYAMNNVLLAHFLIQYK
jgi:hypothetical protein